MKSPKLVLVEWIDACHAPAGWLFGEDNPKNHCSGFAVLTIKDGELLYPEFCYVRNGVAYFRGAEV